MHSGQSGLAQLPPTHSKQRLVKCFFIRMTMPLRLEDDISEINSLNRILNLKSCYSADLLHFSKYFISIISFALFSPDLRSSDVSNKFNNFSRHFSKDGRCSRSSLLGFRKSSKNSFQTFTCHHLLS